MSNKSRNVIWIVAGMYLSYTGYNLFQNVWGTDTDKKVLFMIFAAVFLGAGVFLIVYAIRNLYKNINSEDPVEVDEEDAKEGAEEAQKAIKKIEEQDSEDEDSEAVEADVKEK
ncbi:MAG: hypothetical protein PHW34_03010 [Hespellia sp.]|nr:hypothetical protein [Hespellia sp.]